MTNLDRLKDTDLLIHGFESFLQQWCGHGPRKLPITPLRKQQLKEFKRFPGAILEYYTLIERWANLALGNELLFKPPVPCNESEDRFLLCMNFEEMEGRIFLSIHNDDFGTLYFNDDEGSELRALKQPVEEFLVSLGMCSMARLGYEATPPENSITPNTLIYSTFWMDEIEMNFYFFENKLWQEINGNACYCVA